MAAASLDMQQAAERYLYLRDEARRVAHDVEAGEVSGVMKAVETAVAGMVGGVEGVEVVTEEMTEVMEVVGD